MMRQLYLGQWVNGDRRVQCADVVSVFDRVDSSPVDPYWASYSAPLAWITDGGAEDSRLGAIFGRREFEHLVPSLKLELYSKLGSMHGELHASLIDPCWASWSIRRYPPDDKNMSNDFVWRSSLVSAVLTLSSWFEDVSGVWRPAREIREGHPVWFEPFDSEAE